VPARPARAAAALLALTLAAACGASSGAASPAKSGSSGAPTGQVTVFAAASLTGTFPELGRQFEAAHPGTSVRFSFGSSSTLAQQILAGAPADVFASASPSNLQQVTDAGEAAAARTFARNVAEIAVSPASTQRVSSLADLARPSVKVALCQPQVPCGALAQTVLEKAGVRVAPVTQGLDVKSTLAYVTSGEADAAIVYATDVLAAGNAVRGVPIPAEVNASTSYPIAAVADSGNPVAAAAFADFVLSDAGRAVLTRAGFAPP
jgi:molybdate transport system substrate-binding protein